MQSLFAHTAAQTFARAAAESQRADAACTDAPQLLTFDEMGQVAGGVDPVTDLPVTTW